MKAKHTPGPWRSDGRIVGWWGGEQPAVRVAFSEGNMSSPVAMCDPRVGPEECLANAHLIAAAPDLLEALKTLVFSPHTPETYEAALARAATAIAKAT